MRLLCAGLLLSLLWSPSGECSVPRSDSSRVFAGKRLALNGRGTHEATLFRVDVYSASLFLEELSHDYEKIVSSDQLKVVELEFHRKVSRNELQNAWLSDLRESCAAPCEEALAQARSLLEKMPDLGSGQTITYLFFGDRVEVQLDGVRVGDLIGKETAGAVLSAFIGSKSPAFRIRAALLGVNI